MSAARSATALLTLALAGLTPAPAPAAVTLEQILYREHPSFSPPRARLSVGRDGLVYLASGGNDGAFVLRLRRDGTGRVGARVTYALGTATANAAGVIATANAHFAHKVVVHDREFRETGSLDDFLNDDTVGWSAPPHVEAGASGDFYALDHARDRVVRLSAAGRQLRAYPIPRRPAGPPGRAWDFRVCEKTETFYILPQAGPLYRVGFDGAVRWTLGAKEDPGLRRGDGGLNGGYDIDAAGSLFVTGPGGETVRRFGPDGKLVGEVRLVGGAANTGPVTDLRVFGDDLVIRRRHPTELFRTHDLTSGAYRTTATAQFERLSVTFPDRVWTAGEVVPLAVRLTGPRGEALPAPRLRVRLRSLEENDWAELAWADDRVKVPADLGGVRLLAVDADLKPGPRPPAGDHGLRTWVELCGPKADGSLTLWTAARRLRFARGEPVEVRLALRPALVPPAPLVVRLVGPAGEGVGSVRVTPAADGTGAFTIPAALTAALVPGRYRLTADAPGRTVADFPLVIGPAQQAGLARAGEGVRYIQYGDYGETYPAADVWDGPDVVAGHVGRVRRVGLDLFVDRLGQPLQFGALSDARARAEVAPLLAHLDKGGPAPARYAPSSPLAGVMSAYSAAGLSQMAILMGNDAGLPLGTGFDNRKGPQLTADLTRVTEALKPYPAFRGWSWSSNWWVFQDRGAAAATSARQKKAYEAALAEAKKTGRWDPVLDEVAARRLGFARDAQALFADALAKVPGRNLVTASSAPYRNVESYPPVSLSNVDEVDLQAQWEQIAVPYATPHGVDFYRRPGKRAWLHPEVWNDAGTGEQIVPTLMAGLMRGADGVGFSGRLPPWGRLVEDPRSGYAGTVSVFRALGQVVRDHGPWLATLENADRVAVVVSGRMLKIDDWPNVYGVHFARLLEAYAACLHAHHPASFVFAEDLKDDTLDRYAAVLVVGQTVEFEPGLARALARALARKQAVFHDGTCRPDLVKGFTPLGVAFDRFEKDPHPASDDSAYLRFPAYCRATAPALGRALGRVTAPAARCDEAEVFFSERTSGKGRFLFVVNNTTPALTPGQMWRTTLLSASRVPLVVPVDVSPAGVIYDVFAGRRLEAKAGRVEVDCRTLHGRILAMVPEAITGVRLKIPETAGRGHPLVFGAAVVGESGAPLPCALPARVEVRDPSGALVESRAVVVGPGADDPGFVVPVNSPGESLTVEVIELLSGRAARATVKLPAASPAGLTVGVAPTAGGKPAVVVRGDGRVAGWTPAESAFGPRLRDVAVSADGKTAYLNAFGWDHNLYALDLDRGEVTWRQKLGHWFAFAPVAVPGGVAVQAFDQHTAEGYHLYSVDARGTPGQRFALYGLPRRLPHRFVPGLLADRANQFAVSPDGKWVATAGDLGLAVFAAGGGGVWHRDWWKTGRRNVLLAPLGAGALVIVEGGGGGGVGGGVPTVTALEAATGKPLWEQTLAPAGEVRGVQTTADGRTCAILTTTDGGRVFVLRDGKPVHTLPTGGDDLAVSADGERVAVLVGQRLHLYRQGRLAWSLPGDGVLHNARFSPDGARLACSSETGTLYVVGEGGSVLVERDLGCLAAPAWLPGGGLIAAGWDGAVVRFDAALRFVGRTPVTPATADPRPTVLARNTVPTARVSTWGNAEPRPWPLTPNLLDPKGVRITFRSTSPHVELKGRAEDLVDGKAIPPREPWLSWSDVSGFAEGKVANALQFDTFRTRLAVEAITLVEDPEHPESWLRDVRLEWWDAESGRWELAGELLSDAAVHTHKLTIPPARRAAGASRWRLVPPATLVGNLRLAEVVFHGKEVGPAHPDLIARRAAATLFDEGDDLKESGYVGHAGLTFQFGGAFSGGRCLKVDADRSVAPPWLPPFGHVLPGWDFEVAEKPGPGQYRYLQFAWKGLAGTTRGLTLRVDGDGYGQAVACHAGEFKAAPDAKDTKVSDRVPAEWQVVRVDLWKVLGRPTRVRGLRLAALGGAGAFDAVRLGRSEADLPALPGKK